MVSSAGSSYLLGTLLAAKTLRGLALSFMLISIGDGVFIGIALRSSLRMSDLILAMTSAVTV